MLLFFPALVYILLKLFLLCFTVILFTCDAIGFVASANLLVCILF